MEPYLLEDFCTLSLMMLSDCLIVFFALLSRSIGFQISGNFKHLVIFPRNLVS